MTPRWPLHPPPGPLEALSSWIARLAELYQLPVTELLTGNLGLVGLTVPDDLDHDPPTAMLTALADRTGVDLARIRATTLAGWRPWLLDTLDAPDRQASFDNYVRAHSVLLAPRAGIGNGLSRYRPWRGPWLPRHRHHLTCPVCAGQPGRARALFDRLPLMVSCAEHGCRLEDAASVNIEMLLHGGLPDPVPVAEPLVALDRNTNQALLTGRVSLPSREVHAGVWFRLLRTLLHEVSLSPDTVGRRDGSTLELIWETAGHPVRAGLKIWQPYEYLSWPVQEMMLHAAAVAVQLAADGRIAARGVLGAAIQPAAPYGAHDGDPPSPYRSVWLGLNAAVQEALDHARAELASARQLLGLLTMGSRRREVWEREVIFLQDNGVPTDFLPGAAELDRLFPCGQPVTAAGRR
ncbi:TniQ family protein [Micromonospora sp. NPDC047707]|uniref:TniQ family protein n=1 Tax=Micromonospora sp. NPDC047707 TaxID=3154498 RepID=UPI003452315F